MAIDEVKFSSGNWRGLVDARWRDEFSDLDKWIAECDGKMLVEYPSRYVKRVETAHGVVYLKYILALTDAGLQCKDKFSALKWYCRPSRAIACWNISCKLLENGFLCAEPVLAARRRDGFKRPIDVFISAEVPYPRLQELIMEADSETRLRLLEETAVQLHEFHQRGFVHGDCITRNLCMTPEHKLVYIDNDRTKQPSCLNFFCAPERNLAQLGYSLRRTLPDDPELLAHLYKAYYKGQDFPTDFVKKQTAKIEARLAASLAHLETGAK